MNKKSFNLFAKIITANIIFILLPLALILLNYHRYPPAVPLFFSRPWGNDQLAPFLFIFLLPASSVLFLIIGVLLKTFFLKRNEDLLTYLCLVFPLIFAILCTIAIWKITILII